MQAAPDEFAGWNSSYGALVLLRFRQRPRDAEANPVRPVPHAVRAVIPQRFKDKVFSLLKAPATVVALEVVAFLPFETVQNPSDPVALDYLRGAVLFTVPRLTPLGHVAQRVKQPKLVW